MQVKLGLQTCRPESVCFCLYFLPVSFRLLSEFVTDSLWVSGGVQTTRRPEEPDLLHGAVVRVCAGLCFQLMTG